MDQQYLSPKEVAALLRCHVDTIYARLDDGSLPFYEIGRQRRIKTSDIEVLRRESGPADGNQETEGT